jgi:hypothetical protein
MVMAFMDRSPWLESHEGALFAAAGPAPSLPPVVQVLPFVRIGPIALFPHADRPQNLTDRPAGLRRLGLRVRKR